MFDLERHKTVIGEHFFKALHHFGKPEGTEAFVRNWLELLSLYSNMDRFLSFEPKIPVIQRLVPRAVAVLVVAFENTVTPHLGDGVSVFPLYPFLVRLDYRNFCCREGFDMLVRYLELSEIQLVAVHRSIANPEKWIRELKSKIPKLQVYGPRSVFTFVKVARLRRRRDRFPKPVE